jgi:hypothetical protein
LISGPGAAADEGKLTPDLARKLLPEPASVSYKDFENLSVGQEVPNANPSPTYFVITFAPPKHLPEGASKDLPLTAAEPAKLGQAMAISRNRGFASIIQQEYITECTCESDSRQARGGVVFKFDAYTGSIHSKAAKLKGGWVIWEFEWPHLGVRFVRDESGNWSQERLKR